MIVHSEEQVPPCGRVTSAFTTDTLEWVRSPEGYVRWWMYGTDGHLRSSGTWAAQDYQRNIYSQMVRGLLGRCVRPPEDPW